jgi:hypothetical protein
MSRSLLGNISLPTSLAPLISRLSEILRLIDREISKNAYRGAATWDPASVANGASTSTTVTVPGVLVGDYYAVKVYPPYTLAGLSATGYVSADDTVTILLLNNSGGAVNLGSGEWKVSAERF